jgi:hypothetical protein
MLRPQNGFGLLRGFKIRNQTSTNLFLTLFASLLLLGELLPSGDGCKEGEGGAVI